MPEATSFGSKLSAFRRRLAELFFPPSPDEPGEKRGSRWTRLGFRLALSLGLLAILIYAAQGTRFQFLNVASLSLVIALGGLLTGALFGFLFGIPRTLTQAPPAPAPNGGTAGAAGDETDEKTPQQPEYRGNTNLEQISDWLTKIIVGLTLVQFNEIKRFVRNLVAYLAAGFGKEPSHPAFILGLLVFFPLCGFFLGYLLTRLYLPLALRKTDIESLRLRLLPKIDSHVEEVRGLGGPSAALARDIETNPAVQESVREQIRLLAREYENLRATMRPGDERTRAMELVASQLRTLANTGMSLLPELVASASPGERLAAVVFFQVHPDNDYLDWLADRVSSEKPFIGYHAAVALLYAARTYRGRVLPTIQKAKSYLGLELANSDRAKVLDQAEQAARGMA